MAKKLTYEQWQQLLEALKNAVSKRESGEGGGHVAYIHLLNRLGYHPMSSQEAERVAQKVLGESGPPE